MKNSGKINTHRKVFIVSLVLTFSLLLSACGISEPTAGSTGAFSNAASQLQQAAEDAKENAQEEAEETSDNVKAAVQDYQMNHFAGDYISDESKQEVADSLDSSDYAYQMLSEDEKSLYVEELTIFRSFQKDIRISTKDTDLVDKIYKAILMDHPELFYMDGYTITEYTLNGKTEFYGLGADYTCTQEETQEYQTRLDEAADEILSGIDEGSSDYEKEKYIYDYIIENTDYVESAPDNQNIISVLLNGESVCQGYSYTFQYLLKKLGIPCTTVSGTATDSTGAVQNHAWNIVWLDGSPYYTDVTWGDPVTAGIEGENESAGGSAASSEDSDPYDTSTYISYEYFNLTSTLMNEDHTPESVVELPEADQTQYNYYIYNGCYYDEYDLGLVTERITNAITNGDGYLTMKFASSDLYEEYIYRLFDQREIFNAAPALKNGVHYTAEPDRNILVIRLS